MKLLTLQQLENALQDTKGLHATIRDYHKVLLEALNKEIVKGFEQEASKVQAKNWREESQPVPKQPEIVAGRPIQELIKRFSKSLTGPHRS